MSEQENQRRTSVLENVESEGAESRDLEQERDRRSRLFRTIALISALGTTPVLVLFIVLGFQSAAFPSRYLVPVVAGFIACDLFAFWLSGRGSPAWPTGIYMVSLTTVASVLMHFTGGHTGPMTLVLISVPVLAGSLAGRSTTRWTAILVGSIYGLYALTNSAGLLTPSEMPGATQRWLHVAVFIIVLAAMALIVATFNRLVQSALDTAHRRGNELAGASHQALLAAEAERSARQREERTAQQLRLAVQQFAAFLEQVSAGDYDARLDLGAFDANEPGMRSLHALGRDLNATVDVLVGTLTNMQLVQRRYTSEAWAEFVRLGDLASGFVYRHGQVSALGQAQAPAAADTIQRIVVRLPAMEQAMRDQQLVVQGDELALPILLNGALIGVLGARRAGVSQSEEVKQQEQAVGTVDPGAAHTWSDEELTVIRLAADQLAQTIENLRLLDVTRRNAARERTIGRVTGQIRQELDLERLLRTAVDQIQEAMNLERVAVRLAPGGERDGPDQTFMPADLQG